MPLHASSLHRPTCPPGSEFHCGSTSTAALPAPFAAPAPLKRCPTSALSPLPAPLKRCPTFERCSTSDFVGPFDFVGRPFRGAGKYRQYTVLFVSCGVINALGKLRMSPSAAGVSV